MNRLLAALMLAAIAFTGNASVTSVSQVRQVLYLDPNVDVVESLTILAAGGDHAAMLMLAETLADAPRLKDVSAAISWYQRAFDQGRGSLSALPAMAQIADRTPYFRTRIRQQLVDNLDWYDPFESAASVTATLDQILVFPHLLPTTRGRELLRLYRLACIEGCRPLLYEARLTEAEGRLAEASTLLEKAMLSEPRAVGLYLNVHGDAGPDRLLDWSGHHLDTLESMPLPAVIAVLGPLVNRSPGYDQNVQTWLDHAVNRGSEQALQLQAQFMLNLPDVFSARDALAAIERLRTVDPVEADFMHAQALMVRDWLTLDPQGAYDELTALQEQAPTRATLNIAQLYNMGGLDEPDPLRAIGIYHTLIKEEANPTAYERIATLYAGTQGLCTDNLQAYAYGHVARRLGQVRVEPLMDRLQVELDPATQTAALELADELLYELEHHL